MNPNAFRITERHTTRDFFAAPYAGDLGPGHGGYTSPFNLRRDTAGTLYLRRYAAIFPDRKGVQFIMVRHGEDGRWACQVHEPSARVAEFTPATDWAPHWTPEQLAADGYILPVAYQGEWR